jgi:protein-S-isoprenylcysteine O-methyltransferase Ste14
MHIGAVLRESRILPARAFQKGSKAYDLLAAAPLILLYTLSAASLMHVVQEKTLQVDLSRPDIALWLTILAKLAGLVLMTLLTVVLFLRRPPLASARGVMPRIAALAGTYMALSIMLLPTREMSAAMAAVSVALAFGGTSFAIYSVRYLGRSFSLMAEARQLVTSGPYSRIRHPLYVGEGLAIIGVTLQYLSPLALLLLTVQICWQLYRMGCEEAVLEQNFPDYSAYKKRTARLIPGVY